MRIVNKFIALALAASGLSFSEAAFAAGASGPVWEKAPDRADWAKAYPAKAAQAGLSGDVKMRCSASAAGLLEDCAVVSESPTGQGFGAAALSLARGMELKPTTADGKPVAGRSFIVPIKFEPGVLKGANVIRQPEWVREPTQEELMAYYPAKASGAARVVVHCNVTDRGLMQGCSLTHEEPTGRGYGAAALAMTELFVMRPMTVDGEPVGGGEVNIPIIWQFDSRLSLGVTKVLTTPPWIAAPTAAEMAAAFPPSAIGRLASAHVILRCMLRGDGGLKRCDNISELPSWPGLEAAARSLVEDFRLPPAQRAGEYDDLLVDVPFDFRDPRKTAPGVEIRDPIWIRRINPNSVTQLFPAAAIKAGYKVGRASVECTVAADGTLDGCATVTEEPAGLGFADAALKVASVMQMSPWTKQGAPAEGARIVLPIKFVLPPDASAAGSPAKKP